MPFSFIPVVCYSHSELYQLDVNPIQSYQLDENPILILYHLGIIPFSVIPIQSFAIWM